MKLPSKLLGVAGLCFNLMLMVGCDMHTNRAHALRAKRNNCIGRLLVSLEMYKESNGNMPASLAALRNYDPRVRDISVGEYSYLPQGIVLADGSTWLLTVPDPIHTNELVVGKLPYEIAVRLPKVN